MVLEEITDFRELDALRQEWSELWERCPSATPFQAPEWLLPWWKHLGRGRLWAVALRREGRLVGLAPLFVSRYIGMPLRRVGLLGTGDSDYLDLLMEPDSAADGARLLLDLLAARRARWDFCDFQQLPPGSPLLEAAPPPGFRLGVRKQEVCPVLPLPRSVEGFREALPSRFRANLRYSRRRLERETGASFALADASTLDADLDALFAAHGARWNRRFMPGAFAGERVRCFHREAAAGILARGRLRLHTLHVRGAARAALYCFADGRRGYYYSGGFQPDLARFSPGALLIEQAIEETICSGVGEFDFLRGDEPYKYAWGARDRWNHRLLLWRCGLSGSLVPILNRLEVRAEHALKHAARRLAAVRR